MYETLHSSSWGAKSDSYPNIMLQNLPANLVVLLSGIGGDELFAGYPWRYFYTNTPKTFNEFQEMYTKVGKDYVWIWFTCLLKYIPKDHAKQV